MRGFYEALLARYAATNAQTSFVHVEATSPSRVEVAHALYGDTSRIDLDELREGTVDLLVLTDLGPASGEPMASLSGCLTRDDQVHCRHLTPRSAHDATLSDVLKVAQAVLLTTSEPDAIDARFAAMAQRIWYASVEQGMLDRLTAHVWPGETDDGDHAMKNYDPVDLTDVLVALRGATSLKAFYDKLFSIPVTASETSSEAGDRNAVPSAPEVRKLSAMSGFGDARAWGLRMARDLEDYRAGRLAWADVDKGILLSSPPGGGKTTFARALAAECGATLQATTYGDWAGGKESAGDTIQKALKKLFAEWRKAAEKGPVIVLIDEIDAIGKRGQDWRSDYWMGPIINSWLAFLDGAEPREGIVVLAATNYPDRVDPALMRPGRLDRHVHIPPPTIADLRGIVLHHLGDVSGDPDLAAAARSLRGSSPSEIEQMARDARRVARQAGRAVACADLLALRPPPRWTDEEEQAVAIHESGHVVVALGVGHALDHVDLDRHVTWHAATHVILAKTMRDLVKISFGGLAAEKACLPEGTVGGLLDLDKANAMVREYLFQLGGAGLMTVRPEAELTASQCDLLEGALRSLYEESLAVVRSRQGQVYRIAAALRRVRYMDAAEVAALLRFDRAAFRRTVEAGYERLDAAWGEAQALDPRQRMAA